MLRLSLRNAAAAGIDFFAVPWTAFVAAFLYFTLLTLVAIGVAQLSDTFMAAAYGAPAALYLLVLLTRVGRRILAALPVHSGHHAVEAFSR